MMKNWLLKNSRKIMTLSSAMAMAFAYSMLGRMCNSFFYEPKMPQSLIDMDKE